MISNPPALKPNFTRRLLTPADVAAKLGYSQTWLNVNQSKLEQSGFPTPVELITGVKSSRRWDERAIDIWLDNHMDPMLRASAPKRSEIQHAIKSYDLADRLKSRAQGMAL